MASATTSSPTTVQLKRCFIHYEDTLGMKVREANRELGYHSHHQSWDIPVPTPSVSGQISSGSGDEKASKSPSYHQGCSVNGVVPLPDGRGYGYELTPLQRKPSVSTAPDETPPSKMGQGADDLNKKDDQKTEATDGGQGTQPGAMASGSSGPVVYEGMISKEDEEMQGALEESLRSPESISGLVDGQQQVEPLPPAPPLPPSEAGEDSVSPALLAWLQEHKLEGYAEAFAEAGYDHPSLLKYLPEERARNELGLNMGDAMRLRRAQKLLD